MRTISAACVLAILLTGCVSRELLRFTILSTATVSEENEVKLIRGAQKARGETLHQSALLLFSWGTWSPQIATDKALVEVPGAVALVDGSIWTESVNYLLYTLDRVIVEGTPMIDPRFSYSPLGDVGSTENCPSIRHPQDPPVPVKRVSPNYPLEAVGSQIQGRVLVEYSVLRDGSAQNVRVVAYEPIDVFNRTSILAVERWVFCPIPDGQPDYPNPRRVAIPFLVQ